MGKKDFKEKKDIIIIGGGVAGVLATLRLAEQFPEKKIILIEAQPDILSQTSDATPCRLPGEGWHYIDPKTSEEVGNSVSKFALKYRDYLREGSQNTFYLIPEETIFPKEQIEEHFKLLNGRYENKLKKQPELKKIYGESESYSKKLKLEDYKHVINPNKEFVGGFLNSERILNWPKLQQKLKEELKEAKNINVLTNTKVSEINHDDLGYAVTAENEKEKFIFSADTVINAAWFNIPELSKNIVKDKPNYQYRLKRMIEIDISEMPEENKKHAIFNCFGAFAAFTPLEDGKTGYLTFEPKTNVEAADHITETMKKFLYGEMTEEEKIKAVNEIMEGASKYINLQGAKFDPKRNKVKHGVVVTVGNNVDLNDKNSDIHKRRERGIDESELGYFQNFAFKLVYGLSNAEEIVDITSVNQHVKQQLRAIVDTYSLEKDAIIDVKETAKKKKKMLKELLNTDKSQLLKKVVVKDDLEIKSGQKKEQLIRQGLSELKHKLNGINEQEFYWLMHRVVLEQKVLYESLQMKQNSIIEEEQIEFDEEDDFCDLFCYENEEEEKMIEESNGNGNDRDTKKRQRDYESFQRHTLFNKKTKFDQLGLQNEVLETKDLNQFFYSSNLDQSNRTGFPNPDYGSVGAYFKEYVY